MIGKTCVLLIFISLLYVSDMHDTHILKTPEISLKTILIVNRVVPCIIISNDILTYVVNANDIVENYINSEQGRSLHFLFYKT